MSYVSLWCLSLQSIHARESQSVCMIALLDWDKAKVLTGEDLRRFVWTYEDGCGESSRTVKVRDRAIIWRRTHPILSCPACHQHTGLGPGDNETNETHGFIKACFYQIGFYLKCEPCCLTFHHSAQRCYGVIQFGLQTVINYAGKTNKQNWRLSFQIRKITKVPISIWLTLQHFCLHVELNNEWVFTVSNYSVTENLYNTEMVLAANTQRTSLMVWINPAGSIRGSNK